MKVGFTGTEMGMTKLQFELLETVLVLLKDVDEVHHGDCKGADAQFHRLVCDKTKASIKIRPPINPRLRAYCAADEARGDYIFPEKEYIERNHDIVDSVGVLIAAPPSLTETTRSGTWATVRYAIKEKTMVFVIYPNGTLERKGEWVQSLL